MSPYKELAAAMRSGINGYKHITGMLIKYNNGNICGVCALGAVYVETAIKSHTGMFQRFPILKNSHIYPKHTSINEDTLATIITALNDDYGWSIDAIATWIESLEENHGGV